MRIMTVGGREMLKGKEEYLRPSYISQTCWRQIEDWQSSILLRRLERRPGGGISGLH